MLRQLKTPSFHNKSFVKVSFPIALPLESLRSKTNLDAGFLQFCMNGSLKCFLKQDHGLLPEFAILVPVLLCPWLGMS